MVFCGFFINICFCCLFIVEIGFLWVVVWVVILLFVWGYGGRVWLGRVILGGYVGGEVFVLGGWLRGVGGFCVVNFC